MSWHALFDLLAWLSAGATGWWVRRRWLPAVPVGRSPAYLACLALGAAAGAYALGTANLALAGQPRVGRSVLGALLGGALAVEAFKFAAGLRQPTGGPWALPFAVGVAVGRVGCHLSGLDDATFGVPAASSLAQSWAVDHGDGVLRHPVALYESLTLGSVALTLAWGLARQRPWATRRGFPLVVLVYALQRLGWEALKPFPPLVGPLSLMQLACVALAVYGLWLWCRAAPAQLRPASR